MPDVNPAAAADADAAVEARLRGLLTDRNLTVPSPTGFAEVLRTGVRRRRRRGRVATVAACIGVAASVAAVVLVAPAIVRDASSTTPATGAAGIVEVWRPGTPTLLPSSLATPAALAISGGVVWVAGADADAVVRVDATTRAVRPLASSAAGVVTSLAATPRHLWVALHLGTTPSTCRIEERSTARGALAWSATMPCDPSSPGPVVTANGPHAWVATTNADQTQLRLYQDGRGLVTQQTLPGALVSSGLFAIGGSDVYLVTARARETPVLWRYTADHLAPVGSIDVPGARLMAYGSGRVYVADGTRVSSYAGDLTGQRPLAQVTVRSLTTGDGIVWADANGYDAGSGARVAVAAIGVDDSALIRADGSVLWMVASTSEGVTVASATR